MGSQERPPTRLDMIKVLLETLGSDPFLVVNKRLLMKFGPMKAIFISNLVDKYRYFLDSRMLDEDGGFYLIHEDQQQQTGMNEDQIRRCKKELVSDGILHISRKGIPSKEFYHLNFELLGLVLFEQTDESYPKSSITSPSMIGRASPPESGRANIRKTNIRKTNIRKTKEFFSPHDFSEDQPCLIPFEGNISRKPPIKERNKKYTPFVDKLIDAIKQLKNINPDPYQKKLWTNEIRMLVENDDVSIQRVRDALDWYQDNIGGEYVPVIESGGTFRQKFIRLEAAMKRSGKSGNPRNPISDKAPPNPKKIIQRHLKEDEPMIHDVFYRDCFIPAEGLFGGDPTVNKNHLAQQLLNLHDQIQAEQNANFTPDLRQALDGPFDLVEKYVQWIENNSWIDHPTVGMFDVGHSLFLRFRRDEAKNDNFERDPLTGQSYMRG